MKKIIIFTALLSGSNAFGMVTQSAKTAIVITQFPEYIRNNNVTAVKKCLELNPNLKNAKDSEGMPYISIAARYGYLEIVKTLIAACADINATDDGSGCTPLAIAAAEGELEVARLLIDSKADVNAIDEYGHDTPLTAAAHNGHSEIVRLLIQNKANVNKPHENEDEESGQTPIVVAAANGHTDIVRLLLTSGASINNDIGVHYPIPTPLLRAAENGHIQTVQFLIEAGADIYREKLENEDVEDEYYVATCDDGQSPLVAAASNGHIQVAQLLLDADAQNYGLENAASFLNLAASYGETPLIAAAKKGHLKMVEFLVSRGADINKSIEIDEDEDRERILESKMARFTPLHAAAANGHAEVVEYLISHGARVNTPTVTGYVALHAACESNNPDVIRLLLGASAFNWLEFRQGIPIEMTDDELNLLEALYGKNVKQMLLNALYPGLNEQLFEAIKDNADKIVKNRLADIGDAYIYEAPSVQDDETPDQDEETKVLAENGPLLPTFNTPLHVAINKYREIANQAHQDNPQVIAERMARKNIIRDLGKANYKLWYIRNAAGETPISMIEKNKRLADLRDLIPDYNKEVRTTLVEEGALTDDVISHIVGDYAAPTLGETLTMRPEHIQRASEQASTSSSSSSTTSSSTSQKRKETHTPGNDGQGASKIQGLRVKKQGNNLL